MSVKTVWISVLYCGFKTPKMPGRNDLAWPCSVVACLSCWTGKWSACQVLWSVSSYRSSSELRGPFCRSSCWPYSCVYPSVAPLHLDQPSGTGPSGSPSEWRSCLCCRREAPEWTARAGSDLFPLKTRQKQPFLTQRADSIVTLATCRHDTLLHALAVG